MSAYVVDPTHIDALVSVAISGPGDLACRYREGWRGCYAGDLLAGAYKVDVSNASACGAALLGECIESVAYRYPQDDRSELPGPIPTPKPEQYEWTDLGAVLATFEALNAIAGYEYQSCEHPDWEQSGSYRFCAQLRGSLISSLPAYADAGECWHISVEKAIERAGLV